MRTLFPKTYRLSEKEKVLVANTSNLKFENILITKELYNISNSTITFHFLNKSKTYEISEIEWSDLNSGLLWNYHLHYFDFLFQDSKDQLFMRQLMLQYCNSKHLGKHAYDPYPASVRIINWIKFIAHYQISENILLEKLYSDLKLLSLHPEYHLQNNHLLENAFALYLGGHLFSDKKIVKQAEQLLSQTLNTQILPDGGHFELSPMYHSILLQRLLDIIQFCKKNHEVFTNRNVIQLLKSSADNMMQLLSTLVYENGDIPYLNDSIKDASNSFAEIKNYATQLNIKFDVQKLNECGYRKWNIHAAEILMDIGPVAYDPLAGHSHADTFHFEMYLNQKPFLIDSGSSVYDLSERRLYERSSAAHNTVVYSNINSSEVWHIFRTGNRAEVICEMDTENKISAEHNGFKRKGIIHKRTFVSEEKTFHVYDKMIGRKTANSKSYLHFHPDINVQLIDSRIQTDFAIIELKGFTDAELFTSYSANGFHQTLPHKTFCGTFLSESSMHFYFL